MARAEALERGPFCLPEYLSSMFMQKERDLSFDVFRGLAIIAVIAIHTSDMSLPANLSVGAIDFYFVAYRQLLNFAVPAFIFISGYWLSRKPINSLDDYKYFLRRRMSRVLIPYLLWSFVYIINGAVRTHKIDIGQAAVTLLTGKAPGAYYYWFVILIVQLYLITPFLQYLNRRRYGLVLLIILNVLVLLIRYISRLHFNYWIPSTLVFCSWIIFFQVGLFLGDSNCRTLESGRMRFLALSVILTALLVSTIEAVVIVSRFDNLSFACSPLKFSSVVYALCVIFGFLSVRTYLRRWPKWLVTAGRYSFGIYLIHVAILRQMVVFFHEFETIRSFQPLYQFTLVATTTALCLLVIGSARKLLPESFCSKILGFGNSGRRLGYAHRLLKQSKQAKIEVGSGVEEVRR